MQRGEEEIIDLVNAVVDGEATAVEQQELLGLLASSKETQELFDSTREIARRLEEMRAVDPPWDLRERILGAVERRPTSASPSLRSGQAEGARSRATLHRKWFTVAWAAAAALVLGFLIIGRPQMTDTGATMAPAWPVVQKITSPRATLVIRRHGELYSLEPVASGSPVSISWDDSKLTLIGVSDKKDASFGKASVKFTLRSPPQRAGVIVRPRDGASAAEVRVSIGNDEVLKAVVPLR